MAKVKVEKQIDLNPTETYSKVKNYLSNDKMIQQIDSSFSYQFDDQNRTGKGKGKQFQAHVTVQEKGQGSLLLVEIDLPLVFAMFKGKVQEQIERKIAKLFIA